MVKLGEQRKRNIALKRFRFFYQEIVWVFILIFIFLLIPLFLVPLIIDETSPLYGVLFYLLRAIFVLIGVPLVYPLANLIFESQKRNIIMEEDISPAIGHLKLYKITKKNYKYQILYGILIFFLVFLPIDFFNYLLIPQMIEYQALTLSLKATGAYFLSGNYFIFLISAIVIQFSVAIAEETISRGFLTKRGSEHFFGISAVIIASFYWALGHFAYFLDPISRSFPPWYPFIWFLQAFVIGIILSLVVIRRKWLIPVIIAHTLNNLISAQVVWSFWQGSNFIVVALYLYYPLFIIGCGLIVWYYSLIKDSLSIGFKMLKTYFKPDETSERTKGDVIFRIFFDLFIGLFIFLMGFMIAI
ncbi:MAG: CPBP family intramembrane glutamic endopeptidase [Candidatus Hodarchaeota archaeon]